MRFIEATSGEDGWVVKAPYTTHGECIWVSLKSLNEIQEKLVLGTKKYMYPRKHVGSDAIGVRIPYLMVQPCMINRYEARVAVLPHSIVTHSNDVDMYFVNINMSAQGKKNQSFLKTRDERNELQQFVRKAVTELRIKCPDFIADFLVRVDVFRNNKGVLVVNEFESLEARVYSSKVLDENKANVFCTSYWRNVIDKLIDNR